MIEPAQAIEEAVRAGFDLSVVDANLKLSHTERARQHDQALASVLELERAAEVMKKARKKGAQ